MNPDSSGDIALKPVTSKAPDDASSVTTGVIDPQAPLDADKNGDPSIESITNEREPDAEEKNKLIIPGISASPTTNNDKPQSNDGSINTASEKAKILPVMP